MGVGKRCLRLKRPPIKKKQLKSTKFMSVAKNIYVCVVCVRGCVCKGKKFSPPHEINPGYAHGILTALMYKTLLHLATYKTNKPSE